MQPLSKQECSAGQVSIFLKGFLLFCQRVVSKNQEAKSVFHWVRDLNRLAHCASFFFPFIGETHQSSTLEAPAQLKLLESQEVLGLVPLHPPACPQVKQQPLLASCLELPPPPPPPPPQLSLARLEASLFPVAPQLRQEQPASTSVPQALQLRRQRPQD